MGKFDNSGKCTERSCELCSFITANPIDMEKHGAKLLNVCIKVNNVCLGKKVAVACIITDQHHKILTFKGFIAMACPNNKCDQNSCGTIERKILFVIPDDDECDPLELEVHTVSNYIYPCEQNK